MPLEKLGIQAIAAGVSRFRRGLDQMNRSIEGTGKAADGMGRRFREMGRSTDISGPVGMAKQSLGGLGDSLKRVGEVALGILAAQVFRRIADGLTALTRRAVEFGKSAIFTAARIQELDAVMVAIAKANDASIDSMRGTVESMKELGITTDVAQTAIIKFTRFNLDYTKGLELARVAQDAGVISMQDSSQALDGLIHGITTMNTRVLRTYGIMLPSITDAQDKFAASIGKTRDQLSEQEMINAVLNAVLKQGESIAGAYEAAMSTAGKAMRSLSRHVVELRNNIGKPFLGAFARVIDAITEWLKHFRKITEEGSVINRMLKAVASVIERILIKAFDKMGDAFDLFMKYVKTLWRAIEAGYGVWGQLTHVFEIFMNRTKPLHREILPRLIELFQEYLLPVIEKVMKAFAFFAQTIALGEGPIHAIIEALSVLVPRSLVPKILGLHKVWDDLVSFIRDHKDEIVGAIKAVGVAITVYLVTKKILKMIATLGKVIALLATPIGLLLGASVLLGAAWAGNWGGMRDKIKDFWETTGRPIFEKITEWLGVAIPKAIAILKSFWEDVLLPAITTVWVWVQENVFPIIQRLVDWLSVAIPQAIEIARAFWEEKLQPALARVWTWVQETIFPIIQELIAWLQEAIPQAIETAKAYWEETLQPALERVWNWVKETVFPIIEDLVAWLEQNIPIAIQALSDFWTETLLPAMQNVWAWMKEHLFPFLEAVADLVSAVLGKALETLAGVWENVLWPALKDFWEFLKDKLGPIVEWLGEVIGIAFEAITAVMDALVQPFHDLAEAVRAIKLPDWLSSDSPTPLEMGLRGISDAMDEIVKTRMPKFGREMAKLSSMGNVAMNAPQVMAPAVVGGARTINRTNEFHQNIHTSAPTEPIIADFEMLRALAEGM